MNAFETSTIVGTGGEIHIAGLPFQPGAEVEVVISPKSNGSATTSATPDPTAALFAALDRARNVQPIGPLRREDLYDRHDVH
jgi:hypothetical protein